MRRALQTILIVLLLASAAFAQDTVSIPTSQPVPVPVPVKATDVSSDVLVKIGIWSGALLAGVYAVFKIIDAVIERMGATRRLWRQQMQEQMQQNAAATSLLIEANKQNPTTQDIPASIERNIKSIATGTGDGSMPTLVDPQGPKVGT